ncbi:hypothetical protein EDC01DRAFT_661192 [Geopyxis carbonaria]|nr:hypothetical protein EDC01DRAFT_661192 [Geopyxis carbonaria]
MLPPPLEARHHHTAMNPTTFADSSVQHSNELCSNCGHTQGHTNPLAVMSVPSQTFDKEYTSLNLHESFANLERTLRKHCAELHQIDLLMPAQVSRAPSIRSFTSSIVSEHKPNTIYSVRESLGLSQAMQVYAPATRDDVSELSDPEVPHPLLYDIDDVKHLTAGVTRLLKTLHDKVTAVELADRQLRQERAELETQRQQLAADQASRSHRSSNSSSPERRTSRAVHASAAPTPTDRRSISQHRDTTPPLKRAISFNDPESAWTPDKEEQLKTLQRRLRTANKKWSDEQEDVLELIDTLQEERRKAKKLSRRDSVEVEPLRRKDSRPSLRSRRTSFASDGRASPTKEKTGFLRFFGRRSSKTGGE